MCLLLYSKGTYTCSITPKRITLNIFEAWKCTSILIRNIKNQSIFRVICYHKNSFSYSCMNKLYHDFYNHELVSKPHLWVHLPHHSSHLHKRKIRPPVHKDIPGIFFFNPVLLGSLLPVLFVRLDKNRSVVRIPFQESADWVRDFFVPKEKPFGYYKVRTR